MNADARNREATQVVMYVMPHEQTGRVFTEDVLLKKRVVLS